MKNLACSAIRYENATFRLNESSSWVGNWGVTLKFCRSFHEKTLEFIRVEVFFQKCPKKALPKTSTRCVSPNWHIRIRCSRHSVLIKRLMVWRNDSLAVTGEPFNLGLLRMFSKNSSFLLTIGMMSVIWLARDRTLCRNWQHVSKRRPSGMAHIWSQTQISPLGFSLTFIPRPLTKISLSFECFPWV